MKKLAILIPVLLLAGCQTASERMAECRDQGYSRDTCYQVEKNRESTERAARIGAAQKQAFENANAALKDDEEKHHHHHHHSDQYGQAAHRNLHGCTQVQDAQGTCHLSSKPAATPAAISVTKYGVTFKRSKDGFAYVNDHAAAVSEQTPSATTYQSGIYLVIVRKSGRIDLMKEGQFVGHMK
ncbi:hypothetical protein KWH26_003635 [Salmonella enterica]|nr:hypothetical protein [Salmonella enterica]